MAEHDKVVVKHVDEIHVGDNISSTVPGRWGVVKSIRRNVTAIWFVGGGFMIVPEQEDPMLLTVEEKE